MVQVHVRLESESKPNSGPGPPATRPDGLSDSEPRPIGRSLSGSEYGHGPTVPEGRDRLRVGVVTVAAGVGQSDSGRPGGTAKVT
jgi:hypothetical protein